MVFCYNKNVYEAAMIVLELVEPRWITNRDDPQDQCAHGYMEFAIDGVQFISKDDGDWTVTAAALYLLRTIASDHGGGNSVVGTYNYLIPCCGHVVWPEEGGKYSFIILGCDSGIDPSVIHHDDSVEISLADKSVTVSATDWTTAVLGYVDQVQQFYDQSTPKEPPEDEFDRQGWDFFWEEWRMLRCAAEDQLRAT
jgi:hypothetical protein